MNHTTATPVVVIGNFDGVHKGHQALLRMAKQEGHPLYVLNFAPHPRQFFAPDAPAFLLTNPHTKENLLRQFGADKVVTWAFDAALAGLSPSAFLDRLVLELTPFCVAVGADFAFGKNRAGTIETLKADGRFKVLALELVANVSSTSIRQALAEGKVEQANALLGHAWCMEGEVVKGDGRGRHLGFPTANIACGSVMLPKFGVYAVRVSTQNGQQFTGVCNIGLRPTFQGAKAPQVEVHVFEALGDVYGQMLRLEFVGFIRPETAFNGVEALKAQIAQDCVAAKAILG